MSVIQMPAGRRIFYDMVGQGAPLLVIPGLSGSRKALLDSLADAIKTRFQILAIDNRDAGENDPETDYYTIGDIANDAVTLLDSLAIDRIHVMGFSMGATVALQMALDFPRYVDRLVLVSGHAFNDPGHEAGDPLPPVPEWWSEDPVERWQRLMPQLVGPRYRSQLTDPELRFQAESNRGNRSTWAGIMRQAAMRSGLDMRPRLAEVDVPTLVIHGEQDTLVPPEHARILAEHIPGARLLLLPEVGHLPLTEAPEESSLGILQILEGPNSDGPDRG